jgi:hypothetical protein
MGAADDFTEVLHGKHGGFTWKNYHQQRKD